MTSSKRQFNNETLRNAIGTSKKSSDIGSMVAEQRDTLAQIRKMIDHERTCISRKAAEDIQRKHSKLKYIRYDTNKLVYTKEQLELFSVSHYKDRFSLLSTFAHAYRYVEIASAQRNALLRCTVSWMEPDCSANDLARSQGACGLLGCLRCAPSIRVNAVAEAASYLHMRAQSRSHPRFFAFTVTSDAWEARLCDSDHLLNYDMACVLAKLATGMSMCSDILLSIEGALKDVPKDPTSPFYTSTSAEALFQRLQTIVGWHFHGVMVAERDEGVSAELLKQQLQQYLQYALPVGATYRVNVERLRVLTGPQAADSRNPYSVGWLSYITKWLTGDKMKASMRRAFRLATHQTMMSGLLSTGPILYRFRDGLRTEEYVENILECKAKELDELEQATHEEQLAYLKYKRKKWNKDSRPKPPQ